MSPQMVKGMPSHPHDGKHCQHRLPVAVLVEILGDRSSNSFLIRKSVKRVLLTSINVYTIKMGYYGVLSFHNLSNVVPCILEAFIKRGIL